ncbi:lantibiotic immunity ABC transporter MutE/EpiE family permease subunit [Acetivibrio clariflavus]|uniref:Lantibiotic protection ABC transporter permease subunit, MutE/EpiE family n=1 Tax=Acetivibrio clariflavus (strain DSM 19732 / NBRC 101661 / EBR45) TaxID=720554 RepID=G8LVB6_ACECE|nr:lantibiotic immunity ABC transporter MutE/EpiE family permease subunit [Acetivibrio clariflavus]AEV67470.1 lantibiotic protection ABC transporter permease subunit, MutE/EpiE family [Acetivibrio clariflavus DSM 19732]
MIDMVKSELLKYKRTFMRKLIVFAPLFFVLYAIPQKLYIPADFIHPWYLLIDLVYNWWPVIFIPLGMALFAALIESQEKKAGNYRGLRAHNISPASIWISKIIVMAGHTFLTTIVLIIAILLCGFITAGGTIPWLELFAGAFVIWLVSLPLIPIQLCAATWKGTFFSMAIGFIGLIAGVLAAPKSYWLYVPWSWATRLMCPIIGVHPNGTLLSASDPLRDISVIPKGIMMSVVVFILFTMITSVWFTGREVK